MGDYETFRTAIVGGYDKEDVVAQVRNLKKEAEDEKKRLQEELRLKDEQIDRLTVSLKERDEQIRSLEQEIDVKYKKYIDNYDNIGRLVFDAQVKADDVLMEAEKKRDVIIEETRKQCEEKIVEVEALSERMLYSVEKEVNEKLADGKRKYMAVQEEMDEIVHLINQAQSRFMASYKEVHRIVSEMPESFSEVDEEDLEDLKTDGEKDAEKLDKKHLDADTDVLLQEILNKIPDRKDLDERLSALTDDVTEDALQIPTEPELLGTEVHNGEVSPA